MKASPLPVPAPRLRAAPPPDPDISPLLQRLHCLDAAVTQQAQRQLAAQDMPAQTQLGPRFPGRSFDYLQELEATAIEQPLAAAQLQQELARFFAGSIRPGADNALFNMLPEPDLDATAAACLAMAYNSNCLMDAFGGEALLVEQQVARSIGRWAGWPQAMGISCNGGKLTLLYALRNAIGRLCPQSLRDGLPGDLRVLCSEGAHYCVEHVATWLGLGAQQCVRVAADGSGGMCPQALSQALRQAQDSGQRVVAIVCCGGTTIGFSCDDSTAVLAAVDDFVDTCAPGYRPYLHLDSVIGWLYFAWRDAPAAALPIDDPRSRRRIAEVVRRFAAIERFDSLGVDLHKDGLCPYASSFFIARERGFMDALGDGHHQYGERDFHSGQFRAYRYTLENSRPGHGIAAAWISLNKLGRSGLREYLLRLHQACNELQEVMHEHPRFCLLNARSCGWEVVFSIAFSADVQVRARSQPELAMAFMQACWARVAAGADLPLFSIVPGYRSQGLARAGDSAYLLYPMKALGAARWRRVLDEIAAQLACFEQGVREGSILPGEVAHVDKPIR